MKNNPLISIVVPVYKVERYLRKCLNSIINQSYSNLEIIVVDDGSPDNCGEIIDYYAKKDARIIPVHKKNGGLSDARNTGIRIAHGEYIGFVDSDDFIEPTMYEYLYSLIENNNADISICAYKFNGNLNNKVVGVDKTIVFNNIDAIRELLNDKQIQSYAWNKLYKLSLFKSNNIEYPVGKIMEDVATTYKLFYHSNTIVAGDEYKYNYLIRDASIVNSNQAKVHLSNVNFMIDRCNYLCEKGVLQKESFENTLHRIFSFYMKDSKLINDTLTQNNCYERLLDIGKKYNIINYIGIKDRIKILFFSLNRSIYVKFGNLIKNLKRIKKDDSRSRNEYLDLAKRIKEYKNKTIAFVFMSADYGNLGDVAITHAQSLYIKNYFQSDLILEVKQWISNKYLKKITCMVKDNDIVTLIGGGNMGNLYSDLENKRKIIIKNCKSKRIISFPQTLTYKEPFSKKEQMKLFNIYNTCHNLKLLFREHNSFEKAKSIFDEDIILLAPDIVFYLKDKVKYNVQKTNQIGLCFRDDAEIYDDSSRSKALSYITNFDVEVFDTHIGDINYNDDYREEYIVGILEKIAKMRFVITDRLHAMIFCYITNTPCLAIDNLTHKIRSTYDTWLKECDYIKVVEKENDIKNYIDSFLNNDNNSSFTIDYDFSAINGFLNK